LSPALILIVQATSAIRSVKRSLSISRKTDLMPGEAEQLLQVRNDAPKLRELLEEIDPAFAQALSDEEDGRIGAIFGS